MSETPYDTFQSTGDEFLWLEEVLASRPEMRYPFQVCSVPLILTRPLMADLLDRFSVDADAEDLLTFLHDVGLIAPENEVQWLIAPEYRQYMLLRLEEEHRENAAAIHQKLLDFVDTPIYPSQDRHHRQLQKAYHTLPVSADAGADLYWSAYCAIRATNRFAMLPVLASLVGSQIRWISDHLQEKELYHAAALHYIQNAETGENVEDILESVLEQTTSASVTIDASFLLGSIRERESKDGEEAAKLYERAIKESKGIKFPQQDADVQRHLRLTLAKCYFSLAGILKTSNNLCELEQAEIHYRRGIQIITDIEPRYEAANLKHLIELQQRSGEADRVESSLQRLIQIEDSVRQEFLTHALSNLDDIGNLYYVISALNHGLGYEHQLVRIAVEPDGSTSLEGVYTLTALSGFDEVDTYLETAPGSEAGVHFEDVESLTPAFTLGFRPASEQSPQKIVISIDPPLTPGDQLSYRWRAQSAPGTISATPEQLAKSGFENEHAAWEIIVPMKNLEVQVVIPYSRPQSPRVWPELWQIGSWHPAGRQVHTAYRNLLKDDPGRVQCHAIRVDSEHMQLVMKVNYPWLAMSYALSWEVL